MLDYLAGDFNNSFVGDWGFWGEGVVSSSRFDEGEEGVGHFQLVEWRWLERGCFGGFGWGSRAMFSGLRGGEHGSVLSWE